MFCMRVWIIYWNFSFLYILSKEFFFCCRVRHTHGMPLRASLMNYIVSREDMAMQRIFFLYVQEE